MKYIANSAGTLKSFTDAYRVHAERIWTARVVGVVGRIKSEHVMTRHHCCPTNTRHCIFIQRCHRTKLCLPLLAWGPIYKISYDNLTIILR